MDTPSRTAQLAAMPPGPSQGRILVVDDDEAVRTALSSLLRALGYHVAEAPCGEDALQMMHDARFDLVVTDIQMPGLSGHDLLAELRTDPATRLLPVVMLTGQTDRSEKLRAIHAGVTDFMTKPFNKEELTARIRSLIQLKWFTDELEEAERVIIALARAIDARDPYTAQHSERVSRYAGLLGQRIGLEGAALAAVQRGGLFHDLGKISVPDHILLKPTDLDDHEYEIMKKHPVTGRDLIQHMKSLHYALPVVYHHHERLDGSGYPQGLGGETIPLVARVTTTADIYDALTSARVYRGALSHEEALTIMREEARKGWWDARLIEELAAILDKSPNARQP